MSEIGVGTWYERNKDRYRLCTVCHNDHRYTYSSWKGLMNIFQSLDFIASWNGIVPPYAPKGPFCLECAVQSELRFIGEIPLEDIPLWIGQQWLYTDHRDLLLSRLKMGV